MLRKKVVVIDKYKYLRKPTNTKNCIGCTYNGKNECFKLKCGSFSGKLRRHDLKYCYYFDSYAPEETY